MTIRVALHRLLDQGDLTRDEAAEVLERIMGGEANDIQIAAILTAFAVKGPTVEELTGLASTMRRHAVPLSTTRELFLDTAGTGGDAGRTFNVSTAAAFVIAGAGGAVAKHGSRAATSKAGSADALEQLGVAVGVSVEKSQECLDQLGICFLLAPQYHPAMACVKNVRTQIGMQTVFNLLGPLSNPARAPRQLLGVYDKHDQEKVARTLMALGVERAWVVHGEDGLDEITITGPTNVVEVDRRKLSFFEIEPRDFGIEARALDGVSCGSAAENARLIERILSGEERGTGRDLVVANAAAGLYLLGLAADLKEGAAMASGAVDSGTALGKLRALAEATQTIPQNVSAEPGNE